MNGDFNSLSRRFAERGVVVRHGVDELLHRSSGESDGNFPNAVASFANTVSIPIYPALTDDEVGTVIDAVKAIA